MQDDDIERWAREVRTVLNREMACTDELLTVAERREEIMTEGGLDVDRAASAGSSTRAAPRFDGVRL